MRSKLPLPFAPVRRSGCSTRSPPTCDRGTRDLRAQRAARGRMIRRAFDLDRAAVLDRDQQRTGIRTIVRTRAPNDAALCRRANGRIERHCFILTRPPLAGRSGMLADRRRLPISPHAPIDPACCIALGRYDARAGDGYVAHGRAHTRTRARSRHVACGDRPRHGRHRYGRDVRGGRGGGGRRRGHRRAARRRVSGEQGLSA